MKSNDPLLNTQEVADYLDMKLGRFYKLRMNQGGPPAAKVGKELRFRLSEVRAWRGEQNAPVDQQVTPSQVQAGVFMTAEEVAEYLRCSRSTVYHWRLEKTGPPVNLLGRKLLYRKTDVDAWFMQLQAA